MGLYLFFGDQLGEEWSGSQGKIETMEHSRLDFAAAGVAGGFSHTFSNFILGKNILSTIFSYAVVAALKGGRCWEPAREIPPMTRSCRKSPDKQSLRTRWTPWTFSNIYPQTGICLSYYFMPFTNSSDINGGLSLTLSLEKINLGL